MSHPEELLAEYVDGTLATPERAEVDAHLATCATCREEIGLASRAATALGELPDQPVPVRVMQPVREEVGRRAAPRPRRRWSGGQQWVAGLAAAAALVAVVALTLPHLGGGSKNRAAAPVAGAEGGGNGSGAPTRSSKVALEVQDTNYGTDQVRHLAMATPAPSADQDTAFAPETLAGVQATDAASCLAKPGVLTDRDRLVRLIQARFNGTPAYIGVYVETPRAGRPADRVVVWVVRRSDCTILSYTFRRL